jgi:hypothetical protein
MKLLGIMNMSKKNTTSNTTYRIPKSISDTKKPKDTFIGAYTLEKYEGLSRKKINGILSNPKVSA